MAGFVTINQIEAVKRHAEGDHFKLFQLPEDSDYTGPYFDCIAVFEKHEPVLVNPGGGVKKLNRRWAE